MQFNRFNRFAMHAARCQTTQQFIVKRSQLIKAAHRTYSRSQSMAIFKTISSTPWTPMKIAGAAASVGLGSLIIYGAVQPSNYVPSDTSGMLPSLSISGPNFASTVRSRLCQTYAYFAVGLGITAITATSFFSRGYAGRFARHPIAMGIGCIVGLVGCMVLTYDTPKENVLAKHMFGIAFTSVTGLSISLAMVMGGVFVQQAVMVTPIVIGSLSLVGAVSPDNKFLSWAPYLGCGLGVIAAASFSSMLFPGFALLQSVSLCGGIGTYGYCVCYEMASGDTKTIKYRAEMDEYFDPMNRAVKLCTVAWIQPLIFSSLFRFI